VRLDVDDSLLVRIGRAGGLVEDLVMQPHPSSRVLAPNETRKQTRMEVRIG